MTNFNFLSFSTDVNLSLATSLPSAHYDESRYGELSIAFGTIEETNLDYLPCDLKDKLETSYRSLFFGIPYLSNGNHGILHLLEMTEAKNRLTLPTATNDDYRITLDSIDEDGETVTLRIRNDTMTLDVVKNTCCQTDKDVGDDFDGLMGVNVTFTCYPKTFDWNCGSVLDWNTGYCGVLKDKLCEYQRFGGDVCVQATTKSSVRCSSRMKLTSASGVFGDILSGFFDSFPVKSFEAEWINRDHESGIKYPCLSK